MFVAFYFAYLFRSFYFTFTVSGCAVVFALSSWSIGINVAESLVTGVQLFSIVLCFWFFFFKSSDAFLSLWCLISSQLLIFPFSPHPSSSLSPYHHFSFYLSSFFFFLPLTFLSDIFPHASSPLSSSYLPSLSWLFLTPSFLFFLFLLPHHPIRYFLFFPLFFLPLIFLQSLIFLTFPDTYFLLSPFFPLSHLPITLSFLPLIFLPSLIFFTFPHTYFLLSPFCPLSHLPVNPLFPHTCTSLLFLLIFIPLIFLPVSHFSLFLTPTFLFLLFFPPALSSS